ncbi:hypothetical protein GH714_012102 [Hevea brasiliensis]|uniref:C3H1-type domain-containing protein n=1 Tax=Hevea brasiliensis TaxID=3981 RepID=A0A6A6LR28_HEVBR|nr:hypothetical protein GH714_012102 [Hevea brasiliensis]
MNLEKIKPSSNSSFLVVKGNAFEDKTIESSTMACENSMLDKCDRRGGCQFLHSCLWGLVFDIGKARGAHTGDHFVEFFIDFLVVFGIVLLSRCDKFFLASSDGTAWNIETVTEFSLDGSIGQFYAMAVAYALDMLFIGAQGAIALCGMHDAEAEAKPILFCSCNDNTVYLYDLPS